MGDPTDKEPASRRAGRKRVRAGGERKLKPSTLMMGHGYDPALSEGALKPPIFLTSTFAFPSAAEGKRHFEAVLDPAHGGPEGLIYSRFNGPDQEILEDRLSVWDGGEDALCFSSGMAGIATVLLTHVRPGDIIVHSAPLYAATEKLIGTILARFGVRWLDFPAGAPRERIEEVLARAKGEGRGADRVSSKARPTRPTRWSISRRCAPPARLSSPARGPSPADRRRQHLPRPPVAPSAAPRRGPGGLQPDQICRRPFGPRRRRGDRRRPEIAAIRALRNTLGTITDPHTAWLLLRSLETLELRMTRAGENAAKVCAFLRNHPKVESVGYPRISRRAGR